MVSLEQLLAGIRGVKELPDDGATRKFTVDFKAHGHADTFRGTVTEERNLAKTLNNLLRAYREKKVTREEAITKATLAVEKNQAKLMAIALNRARRVLGKDITSPNPEVTDRLTRIKSQSLEHFQHVLDDAH